MGRLQTKTRGTTDDPLAGWARVSLEVERSRRCGLKFVLARFAPEVPRIVGKRRLSGLGSETLAATLAAHVRATDCVWHDGVAVHLLACDTDLHNSSALFERLERAVPELVANRKVAVVCFPDDALTYQELTEAAVRRSPARPHRILAQ
jgi:hypothetical protein